MNRTGKDAPSRSDDVHIYDELSTVSTDYEYMSLELGSRSTESKIKHKTRRDVRALYGSSPTTSSLAVVAIDIGTSYSGFAFAFRNDPTNIIVNDSWHSGSSKLISLKCPTAALFNDKEDLIAFGFDAENRYASLAETGDHFEVFYFSKFKMELHNQPTLSKSLKLKAADGAEMHAITVFSKVIRYMKDKSHEMLGIKSVNKIEESEVQYVLTIPAIWKDSAKQFMREAASLAGITASHLTLALEPEAAILSCMSQQGGGAHLLQNGCKYVLVDIGGGTVDIAVHELLTDGTLKEIRPASGGPWGGNLVNEAFFRFLSDIFGNDVMMNLKMMEIEDYLELERDFEIKKRSDKRSDEEMVSFRIPPALFRLYEERNIGLDSQRSFMVLPNEGVVLTRDKLKISSQILAGFFSEMIKPVVSTIKTINSEIQDVEKIILVGGGSESTFLRTAFMEAFSPEKIFIPKDEGLSVLRGAVLQGLRDDGISFRCLKFTYGVETTPPFNKTVHPIDKKVEYEGKELCANVFHKYVQAGTIVKVGDSFKQRFYPIRREQRMVKSKLYSSLQPNTQFTTDSDCKLIGEIVIELPKFDDRNRALDLELFFGDTELKIEVHEVETGNKVQSHFEFLE